MHFSSTEVAGGAIMVGIPRSGKTTSLHALVLGMAMLYSPEELELYLIDAKHGVEFKPYEGLPHARMVSIRSDREFSLAILQSLDREIRLRAERMKAHGAGLANITEYRLATGETLPRIVAVIDEFHELFEQPDAVGLAAFDAFSNIVRMGPFSGVHLVVASQTLSSMPAMDRPTLTLLPQRVAFMCTEYDAEIVMGDTNKAVRLLTRTGEGLFNPARGEESRNQQFQGLYIPTDQRVELLAQMKALAADADWTREPIVYDGDELVTRPTPTAAPGRQRTVIQIGQPYSLDATSSLVLSRARGSNLLILGDVDDEDSPDPTARAAAHSVLIGAQSHGVQAAVVDFLGDEERDGTASLMAVAQWTGARYARSRSLSTILAEFTREVAARSDAEDYRSDGRLLLLYGVQRAVELAPVDPYASVDDQPDAARLLGALLSDGPEVGVHVVVCADRLRSIEKRISAEHLAEFAVRVAGSACDQKDLGFVAGTYGDVGALRYGQLLVADNYRGRVERVRGYEPLTRLDQEGAS